MSDTDTNTNFEDKTLNCVDCSDDFTFTSGEQSFYAEKGFTNEPKRCPDCRRKAKQARQNNYDDNRTTF